MDARKKIKLQNRVRTLINKIVELKLYTTVDDEVKEVMPDLDKIESDFIKAYSEIHFK